MANSGRSATQVNCRIISHIVGIDPVKDVVIGISDDVPVTQAVGSAGRFGIKCHLI